MIEAIDRGAPTPFVAITASPVSTIGSRAGAAVLVAVSSQDAVTHTQAFCGSVAAALAVWAVVTDDPVLHAAVRGAPEIVANAVATALPWAEGLPTEARRRDRLRLAARLGRRTRRRLAAEGGRRRSRGGCRRTKGATSAMYALRPGHLVVSQPTIGDSLLDEAERICSARGATVIRAPADSRTRGSVPSPPSRPP